MSKSTDLYLGLPSGLHKRVMWPAREFRTNPLSHIPGGADVIIEYSDKKVLGYDWIKFPSSYIRSVWWAQVCKSSDYEYADLKEITKNDENVLFSKTVSRLFIRRNLQEKEIKNILLVEHYVELWTSTTSKTTPWEALKEYNQSKRDSSVLEEVPVKEVTHTTKENHTLSNSRVYKGDVIKKMPAYYTLVLVLNITDRGIVVQVESVFTQGQILCFVSHERFAMFNIKVPIKARTWASKSKATRSKKGAFAKYSKEYTQKIDGLLTTYPLTIKGEPWMVERNGKVTKEQWSGLEPPVPF